MLHFVGLPVQRTKAQRLIMAQCTRRKSPIDGFDQIGEPRATRQHVGTRCSRLSFLFFRRALLAAIFFVFSAGRCSRLSFLFFSAGRCSRLSFLFFPQGAARGYFCHIFRRALLAAICFFPQGAARGCRNSAGRCSRLFIVVLCMKGATIANFLPCMKGATIANLFTMHEGGHHRQFLPPCMKGATIANVLQCMKGPLSPIFYHA